MAPASLSKGDLQYPLHQLSKSLTTSTTDDSNEHSSRSPRNPQTQPRQYSTNPPCSRRCPLLLTPQTHPTATASHPLPATLDIHASNNNRRRSNVDSPSDSPQTPSASENSVHHNCDTPHLQNTSRSPLTSMLLTNSDT